MSAREQATGEAPADLAPRIVATIGLHGSASTWVFNVARRLLIAAHGEAGVASLYADRLSELSAAPHGNARLVVKSHHGSAELDEWLHGRSATLILSIRDPRDAALSMTQRFESPLQHTAIWLRNDCNRILNILPKSHLLLKYEERFFENPASLDKITQCLGLSIWSDIAAEIFEEFHTDAVRSFASRISQLPSEQIAQVGKFPMDRVTQILGPHIGDGRSDKWRDLPLLVQQQLTQIYRPFLERFGYPLA